MKKIALILTVTLLCVAFKLEVDKTSATVNQDSGISIFILSKPKAPYTSLGNVKVKLTMSGSPSELYSKALKKCKADYPLADGIIFNSIDLDKAEAIKFNN